MKYKLCSAILYAQDKLGKKRFFFYCAIIIIFIMIVLMSVVLDKFNLSNIRQTDNIETITITQQQYQGSIEEQTDELLEAGKNKGGWVVNAVNKFFNDFFDFANLGWELVASQIRGETSLYANPSKSVTNKLLGVFQGLAMLIGGILIMVEIERFASKYDFSEGRKVFAQFVTFILIGFVITRVDDWCALIIDYNDVLINQFLNASDKIVYDFEINSDGLSDLWIIGPIIDFFILFINNIIVLVLSSVAIVASAFVSVKLILRSIELSCMTVISPAFAVCLFSSVSKPYFKAFVMSFLSLVFETTYMALVYVLGMNAYAVLVSSPINNSAVAANFVGVIIVEVLFTIAFAIMLVKVPRVFKTLLNG